jgi:hypothetical protein
MPRRLVDISLLLKDAVGSDLQPMLPKIDHMDHHQVATATANTAWFETGQRPKRAIPLPARLHLWSFVDFPRMIWNQHLF